MPSSLTLPDLPRWVEACALLLSGSCEITGLQETPDLAIVLRDPNDGTVFVIGTPDISAVQAAVQKEVRGDVIAPWDQADWLTDALPGWVRSRIIVHQLADHSCLSVMLLAGVHVDFLDPTTLDQIPMDEELREELRSGAEASLIAATFVDHQPVAFCYAGAVTETLWDISIDTLPDHRRRGYAALCAAHMIQHMQSQGKQPVWQALEDNPASWRLAEKLGFVPVDELVLFEPLQV